jgi:hypothetical protein
VATYDTATKTIGSPFYGKKAIPTKGKSQDGLSPNAVFS